MKIVNTISLLLLLILFFNKDLVAIQNVEIIDSTNREAFSLLTIGVIEGLSVVIGYQISNKYSVGLKSQHIYVSGGILNGAWGIGLVGSYYFNSSLFNSVKFSIVPFFKTTFSNDPKGIMKGFSIELTTNREKTISNSLRFYYELGFAYSKAKERDALFGPSVKIGILYNI